MPDGSSSAAPVIRPGPSLCSSVGADFVGATTLSCFEAALFVRFDRATFRNCESRANRDHSRKVPRAASGARASEPTLSPLVWLVGQNTCTRYFMLTNMPQAAASAAPVKTTTGLSQNALP